MNDIAHKLDRRADEIEQCAVYARLRFPGVETPEECSALRVRVNTFRDAAEIVRRESAASQHPLA